MDPEIKLFSHYSISAASGISEDQAADVFFRHDIAFPFDRGYEGHAGHGRNL